MAPESVVAASRSIAGASRGPLAAAGTGSVAFAVLAAVIPSRSDDKHRLGAINGSRSSSCSVAGALCDTGAVTGAGSVTVAVF